MKIVDAGVNDADANPFAGHIRRQQSPPNGRRADERDAGRGLQRIGGHGLDAHHARQGFQFRQFVWPHLHAHHICQFVKSSARPDSQLREFLFELILTHFDFVFASFHRCFRRRTHQTPAASRVGRIYYNGQMTQLVQQRNGRQVQRVACGSFEGSNAALAQDYLIVAVGGDVLR